MTDLNPLPDQSPKKKKLEREDLRPYHTFGLPLLQLMAFLAMVGIIAHFVFKYFFSS